MVLHLTEVVRFSASVTTSFEIFGQIRHPVLNFLPKERNPVKEFVQNFQSSQFFAQLQ